MSKTEKIEVKSNYSCIANIDNTQYFFGSNTVTTSGDILIWGEHNNIPEVLFQMYKRCVPVHTIIDGICHYVIGEGLQISDELESYIKENMALSYTDDPMAINSKGEDLEDIIESSLKDKITIGTFTNDIHRNSFNKISELYYRDVVKCRLLKDRTKIRFASDGWSYTSSNGVIADLPIFKKGRKNSLEVYMNLNENERTVYPLPTHFAALEDIQTNIKITEYHKNGLKNGFSSFYILYYPGVPSQEEQDKLVRDFKKTYTDTYNAGGVMFMFDDGSGVKPEIISAPVNDLDNRYKDVEENSLKNIYSSFKAPPVLFGIMTATTGFSEQEFFEASKLFINTVIEPIRRRIIRDYEYIFGIKKPFYFKPSHLEIQLNSTQQ